MIAHEHDSRSTSTVLFNPERVEGPNASRLMPVFVAGLLPSCRFCPILRATSPTFSTGGVEEQKSE